MIYLDNSNLNVEIQSRVRKFRNRLNPQYSSNYEFNETGASLDTKTYSRKVTRLRTPGQLAINNGIAANSINPGSIQSDQHTSGLGQLKDCTSCGGGYWGSVPGIEKNIPTGPGP